MENVLFFKRSWRWVARRERSHRRSERKHGVGTKKISGTTGRGRGYRRQEGSVLCCRLHTAQHTLPPAPADMPRVHQHCLAINMLKRIHERRRVRKRVKLFHLLDQIKDGPIMRIYCGRILWAELMVRRYLACLMHLARPHALTHHADMHLRVCVADARAHITCLASIDPFQVAKRGTVAITKFSAQLPNKPSRYWRAPRPKLAVRVKCLSFST